MKVIKIVTKYAYLKNEDLGRDLGFTVAATQQIDSKRLSTTRDYS